MRGGGTKAGVALAVPAVADRGLAEIVPIGK
jgi:hypothetical protein